MIALACGACGSFNTICPHRDLPKEQLMLKSSEESPNNSATTSTAIEETISPKKKAKLILDGFQINASSDTKYTALTTLNGGNEWAICKLCEHNVCIRFLDEHMKVHLFDFDSKTVSLSSALTDTKPKSTSSALVPTTSIIHTPTPTSSSFSQSFKDEKKDISIRTRERYIYRTYNNYCFTSNTSRSRKTSDFTFILWEDDKVSVRSNGYGGMGGHSITSKDLERCIIHAVYDAEEEYYTLSVKIVRRSSYSSVDNIEVSLPERICYQNELLPEMRKALLYLGISPRGAYKKFLKLQKQEHIHMLTVKSKILTGIRSESYSDLITKLSSTKSDSGYDGHFYSGMS